MLSRIRVGVLGSAYYIYDSRCIGSNVLHIPTQRISKRQYDTIGKLQQFLSGQKPQSLEKIEALFDDDGGRAVLQKLIQQGYLEEVDHKDQRWDPPPEGGPPSRSAQEERITQVRHFEQHGWNHFFKKAAFFNLPIGLVDDKIDVGLVGVPFSSDQVSTGTHLAPDWLRLLSQSSPIGTWFDIYSKGVYQDIGCQGGTPEVLCQKIIARDFGNVGAGVNTVGDLFLALSDLIDKNFASGFPKPLFIGGDHAITFPIVDAFARRHPGLCLIHLDAHNDLFYADGVDYGHATPISSLLFYSKIKQVFSFGLRTVADNRTENVRRVYDQPENAERIHLYGIGALKNLLRTPDGLASVLSAIAPETPCYLTIDLDVLSPEAIGYHVSTPEGSGLSWHELFQVLRVVFDTLNIIGADVVEFSVTAPSRHLSDPGDRILSLLLLLIHHLAHGHKSTVRSALSPR